jgi:hypothetical protein
LDYSLIALNLAVPFKLASTDLEHDQIPCFAVKVLVDMNIHQNGYHQNRYRSRKIGKTKDDSDINRERPA